MGTVDDEFGIRKSSPLFKDQQKEADLVTAPTFSTSQEDMLASQYSSKTASPPVSGSNKDQILFMGEYMDTNNSDDASVEKLGLHVRRQLQLRRLWS
jgi:hypothetical protein